ncbi:phosphomannose isomerase [Trypanosoma theileri]|uniref:mannose-6-phosphate isomerase n=1 Tax=Trypanosoma theileri TaxID=67003 RepID=A0A1X0NUN2_9TRYP|nr:phosphomannose isomerase [Trypanosoma theileri]ORC88321.1 phosphomannose isomerase [Trypanosoma theileri]
MTNLVKLNCGVQHYDWGKAAADSFVARMKHETTSDKKFAELWVGTHVNCPSRLLSGELLSDFLRQPAVASHFFSPIQQKQPEFRDTVPFLLKILSIRTALSIQAHPNKKLAEKLFRENPSKYKDPNHKPELIVALTHFEALCCFRPLKDILNMLQAVPSLTTLLSVSIANVKNMSEKEAIKSLMTHMYTLDAEEHTKALREHAAAVSKKGKSASTEDLIFLRLMSQYPDDIGCWMIYFLNYVQMEPGEGLFLSDSEPHAYLFGDGVEIMASSDNVVRAGLTPKWKDVPTLLSMLKYSTNGLEQAFYSRYQNPDKEGWEVQQYCPPQEFPEFSLYRIEYSGQSKGETCISIPTIGLGFCLAGECVVNGTPVVEGDCFAVPYGSVTCSANGHCLLFIASMNNIFDKISKV